MTVHPQAKPPTATGRVAGAARAVTEAVSRVRTEAPGWIGGALAGIQGALFSLAVVLIPMWVIASSAAAAQISWGKATGIAARVWLTGFGVPWAVDGVPVTLVPLGVASLTVLMLMQLARRFASPTWTAGFAAVAAFAATVGLSASLAWGGADDSRTRVVRATVVALMLAIPAVAWGLLRQRGAALTWLKRVPEAIRSGIRLAVAMGSGSVALAAIALVVSTVGARHLVAESATSLGVDAAGGAALAFLEILYAPTLVVWVVSWLSGAGYVLGGVISSSAEAPTSTIPALPLLATLPHAAGGALAWSPVVLGVVGAIVTMILRKRIGQGVRALPAIGIGIVLVSVSVGAVSRVARGAIGPGVLAVVGPQPLVAAVMIGLELGLGALVAVLLMALAGLMRAPVREARSRTEPSPQRESPADTRVPPAE
ncbi:cell division protein PerM [Demequina lutea]|uniref:Uncharacterized protein n=1 Tax=Demequina lutea TaxID=431489 RepID=A0A7Z0CJG0_9MICO|nr:DUF6350 family protein [Demequina lutea]NYI40710.1 hypothetical protein [Demequina lutea]